MKLYSWNVNGIRAASKKGFLEWMKNTDGDIVCLQETKAQPDQLGFELTTIADFRVDFNAADRKGYSGVATYSRPQPLKVEKGFGGSRFDDEGRVLISYYPQFVLFNIYFPNGKRSTERLQYKMEFYHYFSTYIKELLKKEKNIIICGDVNTAHQEIDLARPKENELISGFLKEERAWIDQFLELGFIDTFRHLHPQSTDIYSWWSMRSRARSRNVGWRIDYFFISRNLLPKVKKAEIHTQVLGSDHCPISLELGV